MNSPFDEAKYEALTNGLEVTVLMLSELDFSFRLDSEYYAKEYLYLEKKIQEKKGQQLSELTSFLIGPFGSAFKTENYEIENIESNFRYIRGKDVKPFFLESDDNKYMPEEDFVRLQRYAVMPNDILISVVGTLGNASIALESQLPAIFSCKSTILRNSKISQHFLLTYLNSDFGRKLLLRKTRGAVQLGLNLEDLKTLYVPYFSQAFQLAIEHLVKQAHSKQNESKSLYATAEALLLAELGIDQAFLDAQTSKQANHSIVMLQDSFLTTNRLDAEYYQPKYDELLSQVTKFEHYRLTELVDIRKSVETGSEAYSTEGIPYIRVSDISKFGIETPTVCISDEYYQENKSKLTALKVKQNTILLSKDGSIGIAYKVNKDLEMLTSGALLHLVVKSNKINPDYLTLVLNSVLVQQQAERDGGGSIIVHWRISEIAKVVIPILSPELQTQIAEYVQQSFALQQQSKQLLALAKQAVELAIEQNEAVGLGLIARGAL